MSIIAISTVNEKPCDLTDSCQHSSSLVKLSFTSQRVMYEQCTYISTQNVYAHLFDGEANRHRSQVSVAATKYHVTVYISHATFEWHSLTFNVYMCTFGSASALAFRVLASVILWFSYSLLTFGLLLFSFLLWHCYLFAFVGEFE